jgi:glyoxylase-like metal-dependent hydrolase (beta-lactamase superfamily II)
MRTSLFLLGWLVFGRVMTAGAQQVSTKQATKSTIQTRPALTVTHLTGNFYIYTTYVAGFPANGMYLVTDKGVVVIDSPYDTTQFQPLLDTIQRRHHQPVVSCIATHFHEDRTGALEFFRAHGVKTYTSRRTDEYSRQAGQKRAEFLFDQDTSFTVGGYSFQTYFPGEGHTKDNIVLWFGRDRVLYGGCLVKSTEAVDMGNLRDANVTAYPETIRRVQQRFPDAAFVIPGHQRWDDTKALQHSLDLLQRR